MANDAAPPPAKSKKLGLMVWALVIVLAAGGGGILPWVVFAHHHEPADKKAHDAYAGKPSVVPFGDVVVNLGEERLTRYLRVKILLVVEESEVKEAGELLTKQKAFL